MANRAPVLASNTSSLPEVLQDAALLVNPENVFEIARGMKAILSDEAMRDRFIEKGLEQVSKFSWQTAAERVVDTYRRIATPKLAAVRTNPESRDAATESSSSSDSPRKHLQT
jgi:glycosyltransferase involved in cell wall biosynthesis